MADSDLDLLRAGGRFNIDGNALLTATDIDRIGSMAEQSLITVLSLLFFDAQRGEPLTGFPRDTNTRNHCTVTATGNLTFTIATGWGLMYGAGGGTDEFGPNSYLPIVVDTAINDTLDAHDATNPRIDIVCLKPEYVEDQPATRNVKNPTTGVITSTSINQRRRYGADHVIVTGTPAAEPTAPATPAGYVEIARARVPATSGAAVWSDSRPVLQFGGFFARSPATFVENHVPLGDNNELLVTASSPADMYVNVNAGRADVEGMRRGYPTQRVQIPTADPSDDRVDLIYVSNQTNVVQVEEGTPGATPSAPSLPNAAIQVALAEVYVSAGATTITSGDITDVRVRQPFTDDQIQPGSVNHDRLSVRTVTAKIVSTGSTASNTRTFTIGVVGPDGEDLSVDTGNVEVEVEFELKAEGTVSGAGYDLTDADWQFFQNQDILVTNPIVVLRDEGGGTAGASAVCFAPRMRVLVTPGTARTITCRRLSNAISPSVRITVRVPGAEGEECPGGDDQFSFAFP